MIVKLIQNLEIKMESQINSLETRIEKMQERFNKDLEEIKKSQYIKNNAINDIKNTLDGTNSRITEAEDRISEVDDRTVGINETERKKEKRIKRNEDNLRDLWDNVKHPNIRIIEVPEKEDRLLYPARMSFKYEGEIKSFTDKQKLREFSTKPALQQMLQDIL